jgi:hypothetical protein
MQRVLRNLRYVPFIALLSAFMAMAWAADPKDAMPSSKQAMESGKAALQSACGTDISKFCSDVTPGDARLPACLKSHEDKLSSDCKSQLQAFRSEAMEIKKACKNDVNKFCKDVQAGGGKIWDCLKQHESDLSSACRKETKEKAARGTASEQPGSTMQKQPSEQNPSGQTPSDQSQPQSQPQQGQQPGGSNY